MHFFVKMSSHSHHLGFERLRGRENFAGWKTGAKSYLNKQGHWSSISIKMEADASPTLKLADQKALAELILLLEQCLYSYIEEIDEAKEAWDSLLTIFEDKVAARKVTFESSLNSKIALKMKSI